MSTIEEKRKFEMEWWNTSGSKTEDVYKKQFDFFCDDHLRNSDSVLEIGSGPFYGLVKLLDASYREVVDPLFNEYVKLPYFKKDENIKINSCQIENFDTRRKFDSIIAINVLDHEDLNWSILNKLVGLLDFCGRMYISVHLRNKNQLNVGHDHAIDVGEFPKKLEELNLTVINFNIHDRDPFEKSKYKTLTATVCLDS